MNDNNNNNNNNNKSPLPSNNNNNNNPQPPIDIGSSKDFPKGKGGIQVDCGEGKKRRPLSIFRHNDGNLYAIDHHCYHSGGPLSDAGDIEDLVINQQNHPCVVCPWHKYKISLKTGEGIYLHSDPFSSSSKKPCLKSKGRKQRIHHIYETDEGRVMVILNDEKTEFGSDYYASEDFQELMKRRRKK